MKALHRLHKPLAYASMAAFAAATLPVAPAQAALVGTEAHIAAQAQARTAEARGSVNAFLARADVRAQMERMGVSPAEAQARVNSLSDAEIARIAGRLDTMPAGQSVVGVIILVVLVLVVTDLLGVTDVF